MVVRLFNVSSKTGKKCFFASFWAYVGQLHNHIGWATSMPFASINVTYHRTNPWNFIDFFWELVVLKISVYLSWPFWSFFFFKTSFFGSFPWKLFKVSWVASMSRNFYQPNVTTLFDPDQTIGSRVYFYVFSL